MSLELVNTFATFGTFLLIAATAIAAIVQLRHARSSNSIAAINELRETTEKPGFQAAAYFVLTQLPAKAQDPAFRHQVAVPAARTDETGPLIGKLMQLANFYENMGILVKTGLVDRELALEYWTGTVLTTWEGVAPLVPTMRRGQGDAAWENFEYLAVLAHDFDAAHPEGTYPPGVRRMELKDEFLEADRQYAASLAPA
jgi:hypothetical protein